MSDSASHNTHLFQYPHKEGTWRENGWIVSLNMPRLFKLVGHEMITWKEGING